MNVEAEKTIEALATEYGWNTEGEKSAEDFVKLALDKFPDQSKKIKQLFRTVEELKDHMGKTEQKAYERAKSELEAQRKQAILNRDVDAVAAIDKAQQELQPSQIASQNEIPQAIAEFEERNNTWLNGSSFEELQMQKWVGEHGAILGRKKLPVDEHMKVLEEHLHKQFPDYFDQGDVDAPVSPVAASRGNVSTGKAKGKAPTFNDLTAEQKQIARDFERMGVMSIDNYIKDLVKHGEFK